jgi:hypothetical protein
MTPKDIEEKILEIDPEVLFVEGFNDAIIGIADSAPNSLSKLVYCKNTILKTLQNRDRMTQEETLEYYEYNILGAYFGEKTPIYIELF